ncbi:monocyte chemotactic protein 1B-like [Centropristis striata]|uniref:monocyte chemotactic protein 1B-like n=1 Tax=Centropristis striata TaxID=184440 RepID=UPI0027E10CEF|nr:monocyte chemotactic protein 1B-like [Centropristis striata]
MTRLAFLSFLLIAIMVPTASANGSVASCCLKLSTTNIHRDFLVVYYKQYKPSCPIHAVVFITLRGKRICADPGRVWTKTSMAYIDGKNSVSHQTPLNQ